jgi:hypothetical protein
LSGEHLEIELVMARLFRLSRALFSRETLFLVLPSLRFVFLLQIRCSQ